MDELSGVLLSVVLGFVPAFFFAWLVYWVDRYEKEPRLLLGAVFVWGAVVAAGGAFILNTLFGIGIFIFTGSEAISDLSTTSLSAPFIEESLKGFAVLIVLLLFYREFDSILDGMVYAAVVALGFAATENAYYIYTYGYTESGVTGIAFMFFLRVVLLGWMHPLYTSLTGIGLAAGRLNRNGILKVVYPLVGLGAAMFAHALHNTLSSLLPGLLCVGAILLDWLGMVVMFLVLLWALRREQGWICEHLGEEVRLGVISPAQYEVACSAWMQTGVRFGALFSSAYGATNRFYQVTAELAHKKQQRAQLGEEGGNTAIIEQLRGELARLAPLARA